MLLLMTWKGSIGLKRALVGLQISSFVVLWRFVVDRFVWAFVPVEWLALLWSELSLLGRVESLSEQGAWRAGQWAEWVGLRVCLRSRTTRQTSTLALANNTTRAASRADDWIHTRPNPLKKDWRKKWEKKAAREGKAEETEAAGSYSGAREESPAVRLCCRVALLRTIRARPVALSEITSESCDTGPDPASKSDRDGFSSRRTTL